VAVGVVAVVVVAGAGLTVGTLTRLLTRSERDRRITRAPWQRSSRVAADADSGGSVALRSWRPAPTDSRSRRWPRRALAPRQAFSRTMTSLSARPSRLASDTVTRCCGAAARPGTGAATMISTKAAAAESVFTFAGSAAARALGTGGPDRGRLFDGQSLEKWTAVRRPVLRVVRS